MAANTAAIFQKNVKTSSVSIVNSDSTNKKTLVTAGSEGALIDSVALTSTDTSDVILNVYINNGVTSFRIGQVKLLANAGTNGTVKAQNLFTTLDMPYLFTSKGLPLGANQTLEIAANSAVTATKQIDATAFFGDY